MSVSVHDTLTLLSVVAVWTCNGLATRPGCTPPPSILLLLVVVVVAVVAVVVLFLMLNT